MDVAESEVHHDASRPPGTVQRGGKVFIRAPNFRKGAADGSTLPPYDPFGINWRENKYQERVQKKRQEKAELANQKERCQQIRERAVRRLENERREAAEARAEAEAEKKRLAKPTNEQETDLLEVANEDSSFLEAEVDADALADAEADIQSEIDAQAEADADAAEAIEDMAEMEQDVEHGAEADVDIESEVDDDAQLMELEGVEQVSPLVTNSAPRLMPSSQVTYGREDLQDESFDNQGGRAVFSRRARGRQIVRFERRATSSGGQAVVHGVTRTPCGKEITDKGLFGAKVLANPGETVAAVDPQAPILNDENLPFIKQFPVVPMFKEEKTLDEYGDA